MTRSSSTPVRTTAVVCPDWPMLAAGLGDVPAILVKAGRVLACSAPARAQGVRVGQRRREAEGLAGALVVLKSDPALEARMFEPVVTAAASLTPRVEVTTPGICSFPTRGPARYFGGEEALASMLAGLVDRVIATMPGASGITCQVGVADGPFAALLAATGGSGQVTVVERGGTAQFLAPFPLEVLDIPELVDLLYRLGIRTLGELGEMPEGAVTARLGAEGRRAWHLAHGIEDRSLVLTDPPPELAVTRELDPPEERIDATAFAAAGLADELSRRLGELELACTRLLIEVETEHGETSSRLWRADRPLTARMMVDRVRWQLEGWLSGAGGGGGGGGAAADEPTAGVAVLRLAVDETVRDKGRQLGFWGEVSEADRRAERGLARVQGMLGHEAVSTAVAAGGRSVAEQVRLVPLGDAREAASEVRGSLSPPWPGRIPAPSPLVVFAKPLQAQVFDASGNPVHVSGRGLPSAPPAAFSVFGVGGRQAGATHEVASWAGPWPVEERWWDPAASRRSARFQVVTGAGEAYLLALEGGAWRVEALYD